MVDSSEPDHEGRPAKENGSSQAEKPASGSPHVDVPPKKTLKDRVKTVWKKTALDVPTLLLMAKGGLPPAIALSIFQTDAISGLFPTLGYLLGIVSILGLCILPRAKFLQTLFLNILAVLVGTAFCMLEGYSAVRARQTTPSSPPRQTTSTAATAASAQQPGYNSSASVVCAVWLFFQIYCVSCLRAKFQQFTLPCIIYSIFVNVTSAYAPLFPTVDYAINFVKHLMFVFLMGLSIATGVHFTFFPVTSRTVVFKECAAYLNLCRIALKAEIGYFRGMENEKTFPMSVAGDEEPYGSTPQANAVRAAIAGLEGLHGKLHGDLNFAKREIAIGKLGPDDIKQMFEISRGIFLPIVGLSALVDIFERFSELKALAEVAPSGGWTQDPREIRKATIKDWMEYMTQLNRPFEEFTTTIDEGIQHVLLVLELTKAPKASQQVGSTEEDVEARTNDTRPGSKGFASYMKEKVDNFHHGKEDALRAWAGSKGIALPADFFDHPATATLNLFAEKDGDEEFYEHQRKQRQLYMLLYIEYLLHYSAVSVHNFVTFADGLRESGKMSHRRLIWPGRKRMRKWFDSLWIQSDVSEDDHLTAGDLGGNARSIHLGSAYSMRKDPEHLPPANALERAGNYLRIIPGFLRSSESAFGFRAATATISIGLVAFLHQTQHWFVEQRGLWALIMVSISMNPTAGSSSFNFALRVLGTVLAMLLSWCVWYIPDQHTAGVLVFLWFFTACLSYILLKRPTLLTWGMISMVTLTLIVGYELEVRKVGKATATANGQPFYPIYLFAPYRLATVVVGLAAGFFWLIFPYPISEHSQIRKGLGSALYLLANYYSVVHELVNARIRGDDGDDDDARCPGKMLEKARVKVFSKTMIVLTGLRTYSNFVRFEVPVGGKFPKAEYDSIIRSVQSILAFMSFAAVASKTFKKSDKANDMKWVDDFRRIIGAVGLTSQEITSMLSLMSSSVSSGQPLPPYLTPPKAYQLSERMEAIDKDILNFRHVNEPCYAAFAVMQISTRCIIVDLLHLLSDIKTICGELDFSFHIVSTSDASSDVTLTAQSRTRMRTKND